MDLEERTDFLIFNLRALAKRMEKAERYSFDTPMGDMGVDSDEVNEWERTLRGLIVDFKEN